MNRLTITVPQHDNVGQSLSELVEHCRIWLVEKYGAFTEYECRRIWQDPGTNKIYRDDNVKFEIFTDDGKETLYPLAKIIKVEGRQQCVAVTEEVSVNFECQ